MFEPVISIQGHAIVSDDDRIAGPDGRTPPQLRNESDWLRFQRALDAAALIVLGRRGHAANPNVHGRRRLVVTHAAAGLEERAEGWFWNPAEMSWAAAVARLLPQGGIVAVPGGQEIFDLFLEIGFDEFHLARVQGIVVPAGRAIFAACDRGESAEAVLAGHGLIRAQTIELDKAAGVELAIWRRNW